jgi:hypothetical protein
VVAGTRYGYRLRLGSTTTAETWVDVPRTTAFAAWPNPARGSVEFALPASAGTGRLEVIDLQGRVLWQRTLAAGETRARWNGETSGGSVATGLYWARFVTAGNELRRRIVWVR